MGDQFRREWSIQVGRFEATGIDLDFAVEKTIRAEPNTARIGIYNLTRDQRQEIEGSDEGLVVRLSAGYQGASGVIFLGKLEPVGTERSGGDWITVVEGKDRGDLPLDTRVARSFAAGTPVKDVVLHVARATGAGLGQLPNLALQLETGARVFGNGTTVDGTASRELTMLLRSCGYRWSVRDGVIQVAKRGKPEQTQIAYVLRGTSGLLGTPTVSKKVVSCVALLNPAIYPGRLVEIESEAYSGRIRAEVVRYVGQTYSQQWQVEIEGKPA